MVVMEDKPTGLQERLERSVPEVSLDDLKEYYLDQADEGKRHAVEAALKDPESRINGFLTYLRNTDGRYDDPIAPDFPRLAHLPQQDIEASEPRKQKDRRSLDKQNGPYRLIGPKNPDAPGVNRGGGMRGPS
jgi:hypothetical protein